jgi:phosphoribosyl-AMP cyclohydrolase
MHASPVRRWGVFFCAFVVVFARRGDAVDFSKLQGLVPAVIQDAESGEVLMVGFMNDEALAITQRTGFATFFSRSRNKLWTKGETSGNRLQVLKLLVDCDDDSLVVQVKRLGDGNVCHTGERSCFYRELPREAGAASATAAAPAQPIVPTR